MWSASSSLGSRRCQRAGRQMLELRHPQVGDRDEVRAGSETACRPLDLLQQAVHGFHEGVAAVIHHPPHHGVEALLERGGQFLERLEPASTRPTQPGPQIGGGLGLAVVRSRLGVDLAQRHLQPPRPGALERGALQPVHGVELVAVTCPLETYH